MIKKKWVLANWKMNHGVSASCDYLKQLHKAFLDSFKTQRSDLEVWIFPSFVALEASQKTLENLSPFPMPFFCGAQNAHDQPKGAFTGEISSQQLQEIGIHRCLIGHSERRAMGETSEQLQKKCSHLLQEHFHVVLCIGESEHQNLDEVLEKELNHSFPPSLPSNSHGSFMIAYEPIWAIGTGKVATPDQIMLAHQKIKKGIHHKYPGMNLPILYGGSVQENNAKMILSLENVDGLLIGGASLDPLKMAQIIRSV